MMMIDLALAVIAALGTVPWNDLADWQRFPPEALCKSQYELACAYHKELTDRSELIGGWGRHQLQTAIDDTNTAKQFWYAAWWIVWPTASIEQKREWAGVARCLIGDAEYRGGYWPAAIPLWTVPYDR